jgi:hypothetical protein
MITKIVGIIWSLIGGVGVVSSCSAWIDSGKLGDHALNYAVSETFFLRLIVYFIVFIFPGLILVYLGRKKKE